MTSPSKMLVTRWSVDLLVLISLINLTELARGGGDGGVNQLGHFRVSSTSTDNHSKRVLNRRRRLVEIVATVSALWPISCIIFNIRSISMNIRLPRFFEIFLKFCVTFFCFYSLSLKYGTTQNDLGMFFTQVPRALKIGVLEVWPTAQWYGL